MRTSVLPASLLAGVLVALAACSADAPSPPAAVAKPAARAQPAAAVPAARVTIGGEDAAETVQRWQPPVVEIAGDGVAAARRQAAQAFEQGRLYEDAQAAVPLWLALLQRDPKDRQAVAGLKRARQQLLEDADALLVRPLKQREAVAQASDMALVLLTIAPDDPRVRQLQSRVEMAQRVIAYNRAGEEDLRAGRIGKTATAPSPTSVRRWRSIPTTPAPARGWPPPRAV